MLAQKMSECCICCENVDDAGRPVEYISCFHKVHYSCMNLWVKTQKQNMMEPCCPICRTALPEYGAKLPQQIQPRPHPQITQNDRRHERNDRRRNRARSRNRSISPNHSRRVYFEDEATQERSRRRSRSRSVEFIRIVEALF
jgi:hypothetical protein